MKFWTWSRATWRAIGLGCLIAGVCVVTGWQIFRTALQEGEEAAKQQGETTGVDEKKPEAKAPTKPPSNGDLALVSKTELAQGIATRSLGPSSLVADRWPRKVEVSLPSAGTWVTTEIKVEPGLAYPVTGPPPPGYFDLDIGPRRVDRLPGERSPGDFLATGAAAYLIATRPGDLMYRLSSAQEAGTWTFSVGRGVPVQQIRPILAYEEKVRYARGP